MLPRKQPRSLWFTSWFASIVVGDHTHRRCLGRLESHDLALPGRFSPRSRTTTIAVLPATRTCREVIGGVSAPRLGRRRSAMHGEPQNYAPPPGAGGGADHAPQEFLPGRLITGWDMNSGFLTDAELLGTSPSRHAEGPHSALPRALASRAFVGSSGDRTRRARRNPRALLFSRLFLSAERKVAR